MTVTCFSCGSITKAFHAMTIEHYRFDRSIHLCEHCQDELHDKTDYRDPVIQEYVPERRRF